MISPHKRHEVFGPPHAVLNLSKLGLRYFRIAISASEESREKLVTRLINHPNVGWIFYADGWFNLAIGLWAKDNAEINDISQQVRGILSAEDEIIFQSELTSLYSFGNRPATGAGEPMCVVDASIHPVQLTPLEIDYIKLMALDSSLASAELAQVLNIGEGALGELRQKLEDEGVIAGYQERMEYSGKYFKVFVDTLSRKNGTAEKELIEKLWNDNVCIYLERANSKYDLEFELILNKEEDLQGYLENFSDSKVVILTKNAYTNLYPVNKVANLKEISDTLFSQEGKNIDLRNSKLWYLNYQGAEAYLDIYAGNKKYFETMEKSELDLFEEIAGVIRPTFPGSSFNVIDIGSGDGLKGRVFLQKLGEKLVKAYYPVDIQSIELAAALSAHAEGAYAKHPTLLDIENLSSRFPVKGQPTEKQVYVFFGGTYGNFKRQDINAYLKPLLGSAGTLLISMPIVAERKSDEEIMSSYVGATFDSMIFGPLAQVGFRYEDFEKNKKYPDQKTIAHFEMIDRSLVSSLILKNDIQVFQKTFEAGTRFLLTTSWKPALAEFQKALEKDFIVEKIFHNKDMAVAMIQLVR